MGQAVGIFESPQKESPTRALYLCRPKVFTHINQISERHNGIIEVGIMNGNAEFRFDFNKVGQGLFYSGNIDGFNLVYDCGTDCVEDMGRTVIGPYKRKMHGDTIDLLMLSHFHADHTNGLDSLLKNVKLGTVVIPYFYPIERLILALKKEDFNEWYYTFLENPILFFIKRGAKKVIIIGGKRRPKPGEKPPIRRKKEDIDRLSEEKRDNVVLENKEDLKEIILENESELKDYLDKFQVHSHEDYFEFRPKWIFRFFNYKVGRRKYGNFKSCLRSNGITPGNPVSVKDAIVNSTTRKKLMACYKSSWGRNLNDTSLVTYHGPVGDYKSTFDVHCERGLSLDDCRHFTRTSEKCSNCEDPPGQLLTGDIKLSYKNKYKELTKHYANYFSTVSLCQVPHHGASGNWKADLLGKMKTCNYWVTSSKYHRYYGHPHGIVVIDILSKKRCFCWSNQNDRFFIDGTVTW